MRLRRSAAVPRGRPAPRGIAAPLTKEYPNVQFCEPRESLPYAPARVHTTTLISSLAAVCIHLRPIRGATNEIGAMPGLTDALHASAARSHLIEMVTTDAGNTALKVNGRIVKLAVARKLSRLGYSKETPTWRQVAEHFFLNV